MSETQPTMRYRPDAAHGATPSEQKPIYYYKVMEGDDVKSSLDDGWYEHPDDFKKAAPKKKVAPKKSDD
jgi:hypothetical protein